MSCLLPFHNCPCASDYPPGEEFLDDGRIGVCMKVGKSTLLCGPKSSFFPCQLFIGPEWYCMLVTYALIVVLTVFFLVNVASFMGPPIVVIGAVSCVITVLLFSATACSDPGIVFSYAAPTLTSIYGPDDGPGGGGGGRGERKADDDATTSGADRAGAGAGAGAGAVTTRAIELSAIEEGVADQAPASSPATAATPSLQDASLPPAIPPPRPVRSVGAMPTHHTATANAPDDKPHRGAARGGSGPSAPGAARTAANQRRVTAAAAAAAVAAARSSGRGPNGEVGGPLSYPSLVVVLSHSDPFSGPFSDPFLALF